MPKKFLVAGVATIAAVAFAVTAYAAGGGPAMGPAATIAQKSFQGYYDGHKDTYLSTDVSTKADAASMHINYSASIGKIQHLPEIYLVVGRAAAGQLAVFGAQPGDPSYSPLWAETLLTWKPGSKPVLITSDNQINKLEKTSGLTERPGNAVLNCPIIKVGKG